jgi:hypothetical protein
MPTDEQITAIFNATRPFTYQAFARAILASAGQAEPVTIAEFETAIETLRHVIDCLRQRGSYTDEEGEATDFLEPLLNARLAAPTPAAARDEPEATAPFIGMGREWTAEEKAGIDEALRSYGWKNGAPQLAQDERGAFEAWAKKEFQIQADGLTRRGDSYKYTGICDAWAGWQARAAASPVSGAALTVLTDEFPTEDCPQRRFLLEVSNAMKRKHTHLLLSTIHEVLLAALAEIERGERAGGKS